MSVRISENNTQHSTQKPAPAGPLPILSKDQADSSALTGEPGERIAENLNQMAVEHANLLKGELITAAAEEMKKAENTGEKESQVRDDRDNASLSEKSRYYNMTPEELKKVIKNWVLEMEAKLFQELLSFKPSEHMSLQESLKQLNLLFLSLQEAVLKNTEGEAAQVQLSRLDHALSKALNQVYDVKLSHLSFFFNRFGTQDSLSSLKSSLYQAATGRTIPERELERFWQLGTSKEGFTSSAAVLKSEGISSSGMIYRPDGKGRILESRQFRTHLQADKGMQAVGRKTGQASYTSSSRSLYKPYDMEQAEGFTRYFNHDGNLFKQYHYRQTGQEMLGVLAGTMSIKAQVYLEQLDLGSPMKASLQTAVDKLINYYLNTSEENPEQKKAAPPLDIRLAYKIYYQMQEIYHTTNRPQNAIFRGIQYALEIFLKKPREEARTGSKADSESGVFMEQAGPALYRGRKNEIAQWEAGKKQLEQDWKKFLKSLRKDSKKPVPAELSEQSIWGMLVKPDGGFAHKSTKYWLGVFLGIAAVAAAGLMLTQYW